MSIEAEAEINQWLPLANENSTNDVSLIKLEELHQVASQTLQQCVDFLNSLPNNDVYTWESKFVPKSTIGKHVRHIYDHFRLLLLEKSPLLKTNGFSMDSHTMGSETSLNWSPTWSVNYDDRMRNVEAEISYASAVNQIHVLQQALIFNSKNTDLTSAIHLQATVNAGSYVAPMHFKSTYGRELWFCCLHAIHHYALIKVICGEQNVPCPEDFGVAPSTLRSSENVKHNQTDLFNK